MKAIGIYARTAIVIGIFEVIDGVLLLLNQGTFNSFNLGVALAELTWFLVSIIFIFLFYKSKVSLLSPISFILYITSGWITASLINAGQSADINSVPIGFAVIGTLFGIYYVVINERLKYTLRNNL